MLSLDLNTVAIIVIALVLGSGLAFIGVLIQWSLRKSRPSQAESSLPDAQAVLVQRSEEVLYEEALEGTLAPEQAAPPISERPTSIDEVAAPPEVEERAPAPKAPVRIGIGLRKTRENFLARIRAAITGSKKTEELYEGLEEALIAADVGVEASLKIVEAVRTRLGNDNRPEVVRDTPQSRNRAHPRGCDARARGRR